MNIPRTVRSTDDVTLEVYDLGGTGPLLLLCHATGFCGRIWEPLVETLGRHHRCVAFDFRAHGRSSGPVGRPLVWQGMAEDVLAVAAAISPDAPITAAGHSLGGASLVLANGLRPGLFERAWTFEPILFGGDPDQARSDPSEISLAARKRRAVFDSREQVYERYSSRPPLSMLDPRALRAYVDHGFKDLPDGTVTLCCSPEDEASIFEHHNSGARAIIGKVDFPFAVVASGDGEVPAQAATEACDEFPQLELIRYDDLTHFGPLQDPDRVAADMVTWLAG